MNIIYYHSADNDGKASGAIAYKALTGKGPIDLRGIDYGLFDFEEEYDSWGDDDTVYLLDFSFQGEGEMQKCFDKLGERFIFIDHHKTAIDEISELEIDGLQEVGIAACRLCWKYFFPDKPEPEAIKLIGLHDVWELSDKTESFHYGVNILDLDPASVNWDSLFKSGDKYIADIHEDGKVIQKYLNYLYDSFTEKGAFEVKLDNKVAICLNSIVKGSQPFDGIFDDSKHDMMLSFHKLKAKDKWTVSFYSQRGDVDVSQIAKSFGGGGHADAAGCEIPTEVLLEIIKDEI